MYVRTLYSNFNFLKSNKQNSVSTNTVFDETLITLAALMLRNLAIFLLLLCVLVLPYVNAFAIGQGNVRLVPKPNRKLTDTPLRLQKVSVTLIDLHSILVEIVFLIL